MRIMSCFTLLLHSLIHKLGITWGDLSLKHVKSLIYILPLLAFLLISSHAECLEVRDDMGGRVVFDAPASRIVSLYAGHTENLIAIGAKGRLVAASQADDTKLIGGLPSLGIKPGIEQIVALKPDLVITRPLHVRAQTALYDSLRSLGIKVLALDPPAWGEFPAYLETLGALSGCTNAAKAGVRTLRSSAVNLKKPRPGVLLITNGRTMTTCTDDSWAARMIELSGGVSAAVGAKPVPGGSVIALFGAERLLASDKSIDVILLQQGAMNTLTAKSFKGDPRFASMRAVRRGAVYDVEESDISRPSLLRLQNGAVNSIGKLIAAGAAR